MTKTYAFLAAALMLPIWTAADTAESFRGIPLKSDPPFAVDGDLGDWTSVPNTMQIAKQEQVVWGSSGWQSSQDLSGVSRVAWRQDALFLAVDVTDDRLCQTQKGENIWKGDHVELFLDVQPEFEPVRDGYGDGQFHISFSPGNFQKSGDPLRDCAPEAYCHHPNAQVAKGITIASKRTASGYAIEVSIPWATLGVKQPVVGMPLCFEIALSDTDTADPQQESLMTVSTAVWGHTRQRLMPAALAGTDGVAAPMAPQTRVFDDLRLNRGEKKSVAFTLPATPPERDAILTLKARLDFDKVGGYTPALRVTLNGHPIAAERLANKPLRAKSRAGEMYSMAAADLFSTYYSPDFTSPDDHPHYGLLGGIRPCVFEWRVTDLVKEGENVLVLEHAAPATVSNPLLAAEGRVAFRFPPPPPRKKAGPPTGALPAIEPQARNETAYSYKELPDSRIEITVGGETFLVASTFSTPEPRWVHDSSLYFRFERRIERNAEALVIHDTFTNLTSENLPIIRRHTTALKDRQKKCWLAGLEQVGSGGATSNPQNPTTYAAMESRGIGLIALDDVFRVHVTNYIGGGDIGIADNNLVLRPQASYISEWAIIPTEAADYWRFINAARRLVDANFTIDGGFAFLRAAPQTDEWTDAQIADFIRLKDARYVCASIAYPLYKGRYTHGTSFQLVTHDNYRTAFERWHRLVPEAKNLVYFHCFIDVIDEGPERFADARLLSPDGKQANYGEPWDRIYIPTDTNSFGREIARNIDVIYDEIKADGVYWDEHEYSRYTYHYGEPWDGVSGDIDPERLTIARLKSSVTLLSEKWRVALAKRILARGPLIGNGAPHTRATAALKFPCFIESGSITYCTHAHLYSPIALGDHLTERSEEDAYRIMLAALDYGCVYHWYHDMNIIPTHHHLTQYMYPITPLELHEGYIVGQERIITRKSGLFGWGDESKHEVHMFDDTGREVEKPAAPTIRQEGKTYTELRLAEDWSAAIVRVKDTK